MLLNIFYKIFISWQTEIFVYKSLKYAQMKHEKKKAQLKENIFSISFFDKFN